jgi:hypothetical protein
MGVKLPGKRECTGGRHAGIRSKLENTYRSPVRTSHDIERPAAAYGNGLQFSYRSRDFVTLRVWRGKLFWAMS